MSSVEQSTLLKLIGKGRDKWNRWRSDNPNVTIDLSGSDFSERDLSGYDFSQVNLSYCDFTKSQLIGANFISANLQHANFSHCNLELANFIAAEMGHADLTVAKVKGAKFLTAQLAHANFSQVDFSGHSLQGMDFRRAKLNGANLKGQDLKSMDFAEANLAQADLSNAILDEANLQRTDLTRANLKGTSLIGAQLKDILLSHTDLSGKDLSNANLNGANLEDCDLRSANLENACLNNALMNGVKLHDVRISGWSIKNVRCENARWDKNATLLTRYRANEFEKLYSESIVIELRYDKFIAPHELSALPILVEHLEAGFWGVKLRVRSIMEEAGGSRVRVLVEDTGGHNPEKLEHDLKEEASRLIAAQIAMRQDHRLVSQLRESIAHVKNQFWPQLLELAADRENGQMRMFTVMLMDLKGFSRWKGDELSEKLTLFRGLIKPILKRWKADYPNMEGDSLRASFQNAAVGVACACMIRNVLDGAGFPCRIGMDLGEVVVQHNEVTEITDLSGEAVNFAARLESLAESGEILVSERVWHHVRRQEEYFELEPRSVRLEKGVGNLRAGEQVHCYRISMRKALI
ncbi:pentapeptide repeat-containing protein [Pleionea sediminis]|uniref:pentapeptide repeat-containing protein n=1 Tax=Pleionea sediminis TaxID=2569479 RepID=UPI0011850295|nr:pentapeptide repeat-containing protein [Pleionea sediminis]